jgi:hypothetical protein
MNTTIFTRRNLIIVALIHYIMTGIVMTCVATTAIILNGMYVEYKFRKVMEPLTIPKGNFK